MQAILPSHPDFRDDFVDTKDMRVSVPAIIAVITAVAPLCAGQDSVPEPLVRRADGIVARLALVDATKTSRVRDLVAREYFDLSKIDAACDARIAEAKAAHDDAASSAARAEAEAARSALHTGFIAALSSELTFAEVEQIKDGMTYGVMPNTFKVYLAMFPQLSADQTVKVHAWLVEAREHALTAGTSREKHGWFGKYKGRINNYLSGLGYDLKQAERDMLARQKDEASKYPVPRMTPP